MPDLTGLIMLALAAWRVSVLLVQERGPWDLALRLRRAAGVIHDDDGEPVGFPPGLLPSVFGCVWCMSVWAAFGMLAVWQAAPLLVAGLAVAGGALLLEFAAIRLETPPKIR